MIRLTKLPYRKHGRGNPRDRRNVELWHTLDSEKYGRSYSLRESAKRDHLTKPRLTEKQTAA